MCSIEVNIWHPSKKLTLLAIVIFCLYITLPVTLLSRWDTTDRERKDFVNLSVVQDLIKISYGPVWGIRIEKQVMCQGKFQVRFQTEIA